MVVREFFKHTLLANQKAANAEHPNAEHRTPSIERRGSLHFIRYNSYAAKGDGRYTSYDAKAEGRDKHSVPLAR